MSEVVGESNYDSLLDSFSPLKNRLNWLILAVPVALFFFPPRETGNDVFVFNDFNHAFGFPYGPCYRRDCPTGG